MPSSPSPSFETCELRPGVRLSVLPTRKLKTVLVKLFFPCDLDEATTRRALGSALLGRGTRRHPDLQSLQRFQEGLYGLSLRSGIGKVGEWQVVQFRLEAVNGRFLPGREDVVEEAVEFLREYIYEPCLLEGMFRETEVNQEKANLARLIESIVDNKEQYAFERLIRHMCADELYRRYEYGELEEIPAIDRRNVTESWRTWSCASPVHVYVAGDLAVDHARGLLERALVGSRPDVRAISGVPGLRGARETRVVEERLAVSQARLGLGFRTGTNYVSGDLEAQVVMNGILGGFSHSKLFQNVRERASLAYDISSFLEKTKGLLFITGGIATENYQRALEIILEQVRALQEGEIRENELVATSESLDNMLVMLEDNFAALMEIDFVSNLHGRSFNLAEYRERLREVSVDRVSKAARQLELDTVYFLRESDRPGGRDARGDRA